MSDKTFPRHPDSADISDITDKGWRMMGLSMCFAIVSAFFLPGLPDTEDAAPTPAPTVAKPVQSEPAQATLPPADEVQNAATLPETRVDVAFRAVDTVSPHVSQER